MQFKARPQELPTKHASFVNLPDGGEVSNLDKFALIFSLIAA